MGGTETTAAAAAVAVTTPQQTSAIVVGASILFYCLSTLGLLTFNKWFFTYHREFGFILTITWAQQLGVVVLLIILQPLFLHRIMGDIAHSWKNFVRVAPVGVLASMDYGFSNLALKIIPMTLYEIVKSCSPAVVLLVSVAMGLMRLTVKLSIIVSLIVAGAVIAVAAGHTGGGGSATAAPQTTSVVAPPPSPAPATGMHEAVAHLVQALSSSSSSSNAPLPPHPAGPAFTTTGLVLIIVAAIVSAVKSVAAQITLHGKHKEEAPKPTKPEDEHATHTSAAPHDTDHHDDDVHHYDDDNKPLNPITTTFYSAVTMTIVLLPAAAYMEGTRVQTWFQHAASDSARNVVLLIFASSVLSVAVSMSSFLVMKQTSALTFAVVALGERVLIVLAAILVLGEHLPFMNAAGFAMTLCGIAWYNYHKLHEHDKAKEARHLGEKDDRPDFERRRMSLRKFSYSSSCSAVPMEIFASPMPSSTTNVRISVTPASPVGGVTEKTKLKLPRAKYGATE